MLVSLKVAPISAAYDGARWLVQLLFRTADGAEGEGVVDVMDPTVQTVMLNKPEPKDRSSAKMRKRASMKQEEEIAQLHGGHRNSGSGSIIGKKGDARIRNRFRIENKYTAGKGIRITRGDVNKIRSECERGEVPLFQVDFKEPNTLRTEDRWIMVPVTTWEKYLAAASDD